MRNKSAKLIAKYSRVAGADPKTLKRLWKSLPHTERYKMRQQMLKELGDV